MSFHTNIKQWQTWSDPAHCPVCNNEPMPAGMVDVCELPHSWLIAEPCEPLKGALHLVAKKHFVEIYEMDEADLLGFWKDAQAAARAQHALTGAVKINYEIQGNSAPHLHLHLYPRYLDDPFPGRAIDYTQKKNWYAPGEFEEFVQKLREVLDANITCTPLPHL
jgi:diadenosine tetraphosphate (Ap4A) HIT family hydrolase